jgi:adenosylhomocysteinase
MAAKVYTLPKEIDKNISKLKLASMEIKFDKLTAEQKHYLNSWEIGT